MSRQVNFFITPEELPQIEDSLKGVGDFVVLASRSEGPKPKILDGLNDATATSAQFFLVRPKALNEVQMREVPKLRLWAIDDQRSPVIEFGRCIRSDSGLSRGRVYVQTAYFDAGDNSIRKDADFLAWVDKVIRVLKRQLKKENSSSIFYLSPGAKALQESGVTLKRL